MANCKDCKHSILCPSWGELKCLKLGKRIYDPKKSVKTCTHYSDGKNDTACQCDTCQQQMTDRDE